MQLSNEKRNDMWEKIQSVEEHVSQLNGIFQNPMLIVEKDVLDFKQNCKDLKNMLDALSDELSGLYNRYMMNVSNELEGLSYDSKSKLDQLCFNMSLASCEDDYTNISFQAKECRRIGITLDQIYSTMSIRHPDSRDWLDVMYRVCQEYEWNGVD